MTIGRRADHVKPDKISLDYVLGVLRRATGVLTARASQAPADTEVFQ